MTTAPAVKELTEAELIAVEVEKMTKRNDEAQKRIADNVAAGKPPSPTSVDKKAQESAKQLMDDAVNLVTTLHGKTIQNIIEFRSKNVMADAHKILNLYSNTHPITIVYEKDGGISIKIAPMLAA